MRIWYPDEEMGNTEKCIPVGVTVALVLALAKLHNYCHQKVRSGELTFTWRDLCS